MEYVTVYKTVVERGSGPNGAYRTTRKQVPVRIPKKYDVRGFFKIDDISKKVIDEPIEYACNGYFYKETPRELIDSIDEKLYNGDNFIRERVSSMLLAANKKIEDYRIEAMKKAVLEGKTVPVKHDDFKGYLNDAKDIYTRMSARREKLLKDKADAQKRWERHCNPEVQRSCSEYDKVIEKALFEQSKEEFKEAWTKLEQDLNAELSAVREQMEMHVTDFYSARPEDMDDRTITLLKSGILTDKELLRLVESNSGNPTMLRVIGSDINERYAKSSKNGADVFAVSKELENARLMVSQMGSGEAELKKYDTLCQWISGAMDGQNEIRAKSYAMRFDEIHEQLIGEFDKMLAQPVTAEAEA